MKKSSRAVNSVWRVAATLLINALALTVMSQIMDDFELGSFSTALAIALILGLLNALVWPFLQRVLLPITVLTLGLASLVVNGIFVFWVSQLVGERSPVYIKSWQSGVIVLVGVTIINSFFTRLLAIDDDDFYYRNVIKRQARKQKYRSKDRTKRTGIIFLEIDGLAHEVLQRAMRVGSAPNMARWLREGRHKLIRWECDWSSQTGAMQAGILHGNNWDMPSFRWYEKDKAKVMVSNHTADAVEIERRHSNGKGLLHFDGASRANLVSGDAPNSMLTMSTVLSHSRKGKLGQDYMAFFANPYNTLRTIILVFAEIFREIIQQTKQKRRDIQPRVHRGLFPYPLLRAFTNVLQRELGMAATVQDIYAGRPVVYTMFLGYDEVAHHSGTERPETLAEVEKIDRAFARLEQAIADAPRPYKIVVLADHGQSQGATFKQRHGQSLDELVQQITSASTTASGQNEEGWAYASAAASEISKKPRQLGKKLEKDEEAEVLVMPSGGLASITFTKLPGRATLEQINNHYPNLIRKLTKNKNIGFILVKSSEVGNLVIGPEGKYFLDKDKAEGMNPLTNYGVNAADHIKRTASFPHCPDIIINSTYWNDTQEVAAFEELVGSHGAMGGPQQYPFILHPASFKPPKHEIIGAEQVHKQFRNWMVNLGWESYKV
jgi:uncharacterized membrane protein YvlD (DUF360 family)